MSTYIVLALSLLLVIALSIRDARMRPKFEGDSPDEYLSNSIDYIPGYHVFFRELPISKKFNLGIIPTLILISIAVFLLFLIASAIDGTLTIPDIKTADGVIENLGFLEDYSLIGLLIGIMLLMYLFHRVKQLVPQALKQLIENSVAKAPERKAEAEDYVKKVASVIYQTKKGRTKWWIALEIGLGIAFATALIIQQSSQVWNPQETVTWAYPPYIWGNTAFLILASIGIVYLFRIGVAFIFRLVWGMWHLGKTLSDEKILHFEPLHPDNAGGLGEFGRLTWSIDLVLLPIVISIPMRYTLYGVDLFFWGLAIFCTVAIPLLFFVPLWGVHQGMANAKRDELKSLSKQFNRIAPKVRVWWDNDEMTPKDDDLEAQQTMERVIKLHERISQMPVWPVNARTLSQVVVYLSMPIVMILVGQIVK